MQHQIGPGGKAGEGVAVPHGTHHGTCGDEGGHDADGSGSVRIAAHIHTIVRHKAHTAAGKRKRTDRGASKRAA